MGQDQSSENESDLQLPDDLITFSKQLASFGARPVSVNRDQLIFAAGQAAARLELSTRAFVTRLTICVWQSVALVLAAVSIGLGTMLLLHPDSAARVITVNRSQPIEQTHGTSGRRTESPSTNVDGPQAILPIQKYPEIEMRNESVSERPIVASARLEELRSRQAVIDQLIESSSRSGRSISETEVRSTFAHATSRHPILSSRLLMAGEKFRMWINNLIEEPSL